MIFGLFGKRTPPAPDLPGDSELVLQKREGYHFGPTSERGMRTTPEAQIERLYRQMWVDTRLRAKIIDIREMDHKDPRVKKIHGRMARSAIKGGLTLKNTNNRRIRRAWEAYSRRCRLMNRQKLESDARGLAMEGNLPMQWVIDDNYRVVAGIRMPSETIVPITDEGGQFQDPRRAYQQFNYSEGSPIAVFALWQLDLVRLDPANFDDRGSMGRPYLDASRGPWKKLVMTEEDLVIRRRVRAPLRIGHFLEGASPEELDAYRAQIEDDQQKITTDFFSNKKGSLQPVQGDANLDQIADVVHLLDTFFVGAPAPKGLFGYTDGLARDILADMKIDYYEEIDAMQNVLAGIYQAGFELDLLLQGINPALDDILVVFRERNTETKNQAADRALKYQAMSASRQTIWETAGLDPAEELARREEEAQSTDPYPDAGSAAPDSGAASGGSGPVVVTKHVRSAPGANPKVSITPGNQPKNESATTISNG